MKKIFIFFIVGFAVAAMPALQSCKSSQASGSKLLRFNLEKGKGYDYDMVWDMDQKVMGQETKISIGGLYSVNVLDEKDHIKTLTGTYRNFKMNMKIMGMEINVDTDKPSAPMNEEEMKSNPMGMMSRAFSAIVGKSFFMKVDEEGKVIEAGGFREIMQSVADSMGFSEEIKEKMMASMKDQFNEEAVKNNFAQVFTIFPNKEIKEGDSWTKSYTTAGKMPANFITTYTVKEIEGDHVAIDTKTKIETAMEDIEVNGDQTGQLIVDSKSGLMLTGDFNQDMQVKVKGMAMTINGKGKIKGKAN